VSTSKEIRKRRSEARASKTAYICKVCREADKYKITHPGVMHPPGICDCICR
jgi:hypothetical protein